MGVQRPGRRVLLDAIPGHKDTERAEDTRKTFKCFSWGKTSRDDVTVKPL